MYTFYKKRIGSLAAVLVIALLFTGTFAWNSFTQRAFNAAWEDGNYGGRIRDEYDGEGSGNHNKDVFAENFGQRDIFVRVRLSEFLAVGGRPVITGMDMNDVSTWAMYCSEGTNVNRPLVGSDIAVLHDDYGIGWTLGHNAPKYFMPTHNHAVNRATIVETIVPDLFADVDAFRMSEATGRGVDALARLDRFGTQALANDRDSLEEDASHASDFFYDGFQTGPGDGSHNWAQRAGYHFAPLIITNMSETGQNPAVTLTIAQTLSEAGLSRTAVQGRDFRWVEAELELNEETEEYEVVVVEVPGEEDDMYAYATREGLILEVRHTARLTMEPSLEFRVPGDFGNNGLRDEAVENVLGVGVTVYNFNGIMTMAQWQRLNRPVGDFWILDNNITRTPILDDDGEETGRYAVDCDPWFYWNGWLPGGEATSLLLDAISLPARSTDWEHVIHVEADFFSPDTINNEGLSDMSDLAWEIFTRLAGVEREEEGASEAEVEELREFLISLFD